jgi:L-threonylcarbamoyladenylate synthase
MDVITDLQFKNEIERYCHYVNRQDSVFIHPTDTIYGLGCNAENDLAVKKIREIKERYTRPFSVIAPSKDWILENCHVKKEDLVYIDKLPGPYTIILNLKNKNSVSKHVNNECETIGVRIPNHWISDFAKYLGKPIVTTSANKLGENFMTSIDTLDLDIKRNVNFIVYEGEKVGRPSKVIDLTLDEIEVIDR